MCSRKEVSVKIMQNAHNFLQSKMLNHFATMRTLSTTLIQLLSFDLSQLRQCGIDFTNWCYRHCIRLYKFQPFAIK